MELKDIALFGIVRKRLDWLGQRQEVLAQNIANADTPGFRARDLKAYSFKELVRRETAQINLVADNPDHLPGRRKRIRDFTEAVERRPFETAPDGNSVVLEEQMAKVGQTGSSYKLTTSLYRKHLDMFRTALGNR